MAPMSDNRATHYDTLVMGRQAGGGRPGTWEESSTTMTSAMSMYSSSSIFFPSFGSRVAVGINGPG